MENMKNVGFTPQTMPCCSPTNVPADTRKGKQNTQHGGTVDTSPRPMKKGDLVPGAKPHGSSK